MVNIPFMSMDIEKSDAWSIGIYQVNNKGGLKATPHPEAKNPVLTAKDITDRKAKFVADPFWVYENDYYHMFFEVLIGKKGEIGLAVSADGLNWKYENIVLAEPFHLSYPQVFKSEGHYYMVPESSEDFSVRLYECESFPYKWQFKKKLIQGDKFEDPTIFNYQNIWWLFASTSDSSTLNLYSAVSLEGPWREHPESPVVKNDNTLARCAGNVIFSNGKLIRIAQNDFPLYGNSVRALEILKINADEYQEREIESRPLLSASGRGWNSDGMHHFSFQPTDHRELLACVDGNRVNKRFCFNIAVPI